MIYLDNNATTRPLPDAARASDRMLRELWANPSSVHRFGQEARREVELARRRVAGLLGCSPREIVFTGSGTESIDAALRGALLARPPVQRGLVSAAVEHEAVRDLAGALDGEGAARVLAAPIGAHGVVDADALGALLRERAAAGEPVGVISVQWANNETGAVQPVEHIARVAREHDAVFHTDATQWVGKMPTDLGGAHAFVDLLSCAPHKWHGPKGVGILFARRRVRVRPVVHGAQELGRRGGTENTAGIAAAGVAAEAAAAWLAESAERDRLAGLRDRFERAVLDAVPGAVVNGPDGPGARLWNTTNIGFPALEAEAMLVALSERGVCASAGAACSSGSLDPSPVLLAMGVAEPVAHGSLRFSLSRDTTAEELDAAARAIGEVVDRMGGVGKRVESRK